MTKQHSHQLEDEARGLHGECLVCKKPLSHIFNDHCKCPERQSNGNWVKQTSFDKIITDYEKFDGSFKMPACLYGELKDFISSILEEVEIDVIGEDDNLFLSKIPEDNWVKQFNFYRNQLRSKQRKALQVIKDKYIK